MKKLFVFTFFITSSIYPLIAQQAYYNDVDLTLTGQDLYFELQNKIDQASATFTYEDARFSAEVTDEDTQNNSNILLVYGFNDADGNCTTDRSRNKNALEVVVANGTENMYLLGAMPTHLWVVPVMLLQELLQILTI